MFDASAVVSWDECLTEAGSGQSHSIVILHSRSSIYCWEFGQRSSLPRGRLRALAVDEPRCGHIAERALQSARSANQRAHNRYSITTLPPCEAWLCSSVQACELWWGEDTAGSRRSTSHPSTRCHDIAAKTDEILVPRVICTFYTLCTTDIAPDTDNVPVLCEGNRGGEWVDLFVVSPPDVLTFHYSSSRMNENFRFFQLSLKDLWTSISNWEKINIKQFVYCCNKVIRFHTKIK